MKLHWYRRRFAKQQFLSCSHGQYPQPIRRRAHGAQSADRAELTRIEQRLAAKLASDPVQSKRLYKIWRGWGGRANPQTGDIWIDVFRDQGDERRNRWKIFRDLGHEYVHLVGHPAYRRYAGTFGWTSPQFNTLMEGVDDVLTDAVTLSLGPRVARLRDVVEGREFRNDPPVTPEGSGAWAGTGPTPRRWR